MKQLKTLATTLRSYGFIKEALFVHNLTDGEEPYDPYVIAYKSDVWLIDEDYLYDKIDKLPENSKNMINDIK